MPRNQAANRRQKLGDEVSRLLIWRAVSCIMAFCVVLEGIVTCVKTCRNLKCQQEREMSAIAFVLMTHADHIIVGEAETVCGRFARGEKA